ncbi:MAG: chromosomal replication initiator protein DnaA [Rhodospirillales bacterium]
MLEEAWRTARARLRDQVGAAAFSSWLEPLTPIALRDGVLRLAVPTRFMRDWVRGNYADQIADLMIEASSQVEAVEIIVQPPARPPGKPSEPCQNAAHADEKTAGKAAAKPKQTKTRASSQAAGTRDAAAEDAAGDSDPPGETGGESFSAPLDARFTFEDFVVGKPNELAYAAARRVAEAEEVPFNPLFLYGGVGLGKTHLMHSIAWQLRRQHPAKRLIYISAEKFMYQFVRALRTRDTMAFKEQFRSIDVLMVDDVQFIAGREATQEEFFHTFNTLVDQNRQVVISADKSPHDLTGMEERLRSRLGYGLVADIHPTTYELRLGILTAKRERAPVDIPLKVLEFLAHRITSNVRELEGALTRIVAHATLVGRRITLESTQELLQDLLRANSRRVTIDDIQKKVAEHFKIRLSEMSSPRRARAVARPRQIAMYLSKQLTQASLPEIGKKFGGRDHTTVMHAVRKVEELRQEDAAFDEDVELLRRMLDS